MCTCGADLSQLISSGAEQIVTALQRAAAEGLGVDELTGVLQTVFARRNQIDAAVSAAVAALDRAAEAAPEGIDTMGLSCPAWLSHNLHISSSAAYAQVHLARQLPGLPDTAAAFERGELSAQHAGVVARCVPALVAGSRTARDAERA